MPHNNRVPAGRALVTSDIWSKTIGHDPYAATENDGITESEAALHAEKTKTLLELAKHQNLGVNNRSSKDGADDFARKMFLGLKSGKKRLRMDVSSLGEECADDQRNVTEEMARCLEAESSSSEEEFVEEEEKEDEKERGLKPVGAGVRDGGKVSDGGAVKKTSIGRKKSRKKKKKSKKSRDDISYSSDDSSRERHRHRKKHRRRKEERRDRRKRHDRKRRRKRDSDDGSSQSGTSDGQSAVEEKSRRLRDSSKGRRKHSSSNNERKEDNVNSGNKSLQKEKPVDA